jgi:hypothetical protein
MRTLKTIRALKLIGAGSLIAFAVPSLADVKDGVDAWSAGDYAAAVNEWTGPAAAGDPDAQFNMAQAYRLGRGVTSDTKQAEQLYKSAAAQGHLKAADNYGLLLFQDGRRNEAMPYVNSAAGRGDPRAQYLLGIAHFNGDLVKKDWVRAYALMTLSNGTGLPQARNAMAEMDKYVPLEQRREAQSLAQSLKAEAEANRARSLAAADLQFGAPQQAGMPMPSPAAASAPAVAAAPTAPAPSRPSARASMPKPGPNPAPKPVTVASSAAGADYTLPGTRTAPAPASPPSAQPRRAATPTPSRTAMNGPWKVQLGAFGVASNADRLWGRVGSHPALSGAKQLKVPAGRLTRLQAGGFASRSAANAACGQLKRSGHSCLVTK